MARIKLGLTVSASIREDTPIAWSKGLARGPISITIGDIEDRTPELYLYCDRDALDRLITVAMEARASYGVTAKACHECGGVGTEHAPDCGNYQDPKDWA